MYGYVYLTTNEVNLKVYLVKVLITVDFLVKRKVQRLSKGYLKRNT